MDGIRIDLYYLTVMRPVRFLNESAAFRSKLLSVRGIGIGEVMPPSFIERPSGTGDYLFMLFFDAVALGQQRRPLQPGTMVMWDRGSPHHYGCPTRRWRHSWLHCDGKAVEKIRISAGISGEKIVRLSDPSVVDRHLLDVHVEIGRGRRADPVIVRNLIENLVRAGSRGDEAPPEATPVPTAIAAACVHIDSHYDGALTLAHLAKIAGLSPGHFCTQFRSHYGVPPMAYLLHRRLQAAAALIRGTSDSVGDVGRRVGFPDPYYFSKRFKLQFGLSPSQLRSRSNSK